MGVVCKNCDNFPGGFNDLTLYINGIEKPMKYRPDVGNVISCQDMGYFQDRQRRYAPNSYTSIQHIIPQEGGEVRFQLKSLCSYPLYSGAVPPSGFIVGKLNSNSEYVDGPYNGYDITINFPPYSGGTGFIILGWCGVFYSSESQFLEECQSPGNLGNGNCEFCVTFNIAYKNCPAPCLTQTVDLPSTRLNSIVDHKNVNWPLDNGVFTDCIPNSLGTKTALSRIRTKLLEIDSFYGDCQYPSNPTVIAQAIPDTNGNCIRFIAKGFNQKFRILHWGGANDPAYFNHSGC